jgi:protein CpxP
MSQSTQNDKPRRRFFRRAAMAGALAGIGGLGFGAFARARGGPGGWGGGPLDPAALDERVDRRLKQLYAEIDATPEQQQKLAPIVKRAAHDLYPLRKQMREARLQAMDLFTRDHVDRAAFEKLRTEQMTLAEHASKRLTEALADAAELLTPLQRKELAARLGRRRWHRWHGRGE